MRDKMEEYDRHLKLLKEIEKEIDKEQEEAEKERWRLLELKLRESNNEFLRYVSGYRERGLSYCPRYVHGKVKGEQIK